MAGAAGRTHHGPPSYRRLRCCCPSRSSSYSISTLQKKRKRRKKTKPVSGVYSRHGPGVHQSWTGEPPHIPPKKASQAAASRRRQDRKQGHTCRAAAWPPPACRPCRPPPRPPPTRLSAWRRGPLLPAHLRRCRRLPPPPRARRRRARWAPALPGRYPQTRRLPLHCRRGGGGHGTWSEACVVLQADVHGAIPPPWPCELWPAPRRAGRAGGLRPAAQGTKHSRLEQGRGGPDHAQQAIHGAPSLPAHRCRCTPRRSSPPCPRRWGQTPAAPRPGTQPPPERNKGKGDTNRLV